MFRTGSDHHRRRVVLECRHQATGSAGEGRAVRFQDDRSRRPQQQDAATLARDNVGEQRWKVSRHQPEERPGEPVPAREQPVQKEQRDQHCDRVDGRPDLDRDVLGQQRDRGRQQRQRRRAHELIEPAGRRDDVKARDVLSGRVVHVRGIGEVCVGALPHALGVKAARRQGGEDRHPKPEGGGKHPVESRPREHVGGRASQPIDQSASARPWRAVNRSVVGGGSALHYA